MSEGFVGYVELADRLLTETSDEAYNNSTSEILRPALATVLARHPQWAHLGSALYDAVGKIDIDALMGMARLFADGKQMRIRLLMGMLIAELHRHLD